MLLKTPMAMSWQCSAIGCEVWITQGRPALEAWPDL